jgi:hypothetical protein
VFPANPRAARVPFGPGERLLYHVKVGILNAGEGELNVLGVDSVRGHVTYRAMMGVRGGFLGLKVNDAHHTWFGVDDLVSRRFIQIIREPYYNSYRHFEMHPERGVWEREDNDEFGDLGSVLPMDDITFMYRIRTLPLVVGQTYTLDNYFKAEGNPVVVEVVRRDERQTDAGRFHTIVVRPRVKTEGLFKGGNAEMHFTDDDRRIPVYMRFDIPNFPGNLTLHLKEIHEGLPLNPESRAVVLARLRR